MQKMIETQISLISGMGRTVVPMQITYDDDEEATAPISEMSLVFNDVQYTGKGTDYLWTDTLADLQCKLPEGVKIACCMTCCHGNMCPYGNLENQLFCTKELKIICKKDMCDLFDQTDPYEEQIVTSFDYCEDFVYQNDDCYTYNDYLYELQKKMASK
ncbi:MAG: hypothetical protein IJF80_06810 [Clostridia bacterium]|nr:hypothetical protein [Clostridia bacterium]